MVKAPKRYARNIQSLRQKFNFEKLRIEKHFPRFKCVLRNDQLTCRGTIVPSEGCGEYKIRINYTFCKSPKVYITNPKIEPKPEIHIYNVGHLCLYDWRESPWSTEMLIHETLIPWIAEWLVFYEIWNEVGEWLGTEAPHALEEKELEPNLVFEPLKKSGVSG